MLQERHETPQHVPGNSSLHRNPVWFTSVTWNPVWSALH